MTAPASSVPLSAALEAGSLKVQEVDGGTVPTLQMRNDGAKAVFAMAGDVVLGGKQDRVLVEDVVIPPGQTLAVDVNCVERGRWSQGEQGDTFRYGGRSEVALQQVVRDAKDQGATWAEVARLNAEKTQRFEAQGVDAVVAPTTGTYRASLETGAVQREVELGMAEVLPHFARHADAVGLVVAVNGDVRTFELYHHTSTWKADREAVLRGHLLSTVGLNDAPDRTATRADAAAMLRDGLAARVVEESRKAAATRRAKAGSDTKVHELSVDSEMLKTMGYVGD